MDDGYWESLLRDMDNETDRSVPKGEPDDISTQMGGTSPASAAERSGGTSALSEEEDWRRANALLQTGEPADVVISGYNRGGLLAEFGRLQGFLPASHLVAAPASPTPELRAATLSAHVGDTLTVRVVEIDRERCRLILSERMARGDGQADALLAVLEPGQVCRGTVTNLCAFGAFVDLGGFEGLIHISELSWGRVGSAAEVIQPGDQVEVMVVQVNPQDHKVSLSLKRLRPDPWQGVETRYHAGQMLDAVITNVVSFGAFARLEAGLEGLIHISELAEGSFMHPRNVVNEGDRVRVRVLQVDGAKRRIALTMRSPEFTRSRSAVATEVRMAG
jgi:small subunit ribosomal protein S1